MTYVRIRSWHVLSDAGYTDDGGATTRCGRHLPPPIGEVRATLDFAEKSCETCLRLVVNSELAAHRADNGVIA